MEKPGLIKEITEVKNQKMLLEIRQDLYSEEDYGLFTCRNIEYYESFLNRIKILKISNVENNYKLFDSNFYKVSKILAKRIQNKKIVARKYKKL